MNGEQQASETLAKWYAAWDSHDVTGISELLTEDVRCEDPSAHKPVLEGRPKVEACAAAAFDGIPDFRLEVLEE